MKRDYDTPDGYHIGADGVWDGQATTKTIDTEKLGPGAQSTVADEPSDTSDSTETTESTNN